MPLDRKTRRLIVREARKLARKTFDKNDLAACCLPLAWATCVVASRLAKYKLVVRAGSAYWPRLNKATDDGVSPDRFGYEWEPGGPQTQIRIALRELPELHVWAFDPADDSIIDLTTGSWPTQCQQIIGYDWPGDRPPDYWWGPANRLPPLVEYRHSNSAAQIAGTFLQYLLMEKGASTL